MNKFCFKAKEDATKGISRYELHFDEVKVDKTNMPSAFIGGFYNPYSETKKVGGGVVLCSDKERRFFMVDAEFTHLRDLGGEIAAVILAIKKAKEFGLKSLHIYCHCITVRNWGEDIWKPYQPIGTAFKKFIDGSGIYVKFTLINDCCRESEIARKLASCAVEYYTDLQSETVKAEISHLIEQYVEDNGLKYLEDNNLILCK